MTFSLCLSVNLLIYFVHVDERQVMMMGLLIILAYYNMIPVIDVYNDADAMVLVLDVLNEMQQLIVLMLLLL